MTHLTEEDLVLIYYNEPGVSRESREHLTGCSACREAAESLAETLNFCSEWTPPEPGPDFGRTAWARLAPQLQPHAARSWLLELLRPRVWIGAAAVAALVVMAFVVGRSSVKPRPPVTAGLSRQARDRILAISVADHLDRAERLLTEVANASDAETSDVAALRDRAKDLVDEGRLLRQWSNDKDSATAPLLDDVERFVLELANAPDHLNSAELNGLKQHLDSESLLFKVRIIQSNLLTSGQRL